MIDPLFLFLSNEDKLLEMIPPFSPKDQGENQNNFLVFEERKTLRLKSIGLENEMSTDQQRRISDFDFKNGGRNEGCET